MAVHAAVAQQKRTERLVSELKKALASKAEEVETWESKAETWEAIADRTAEERCELLLVNEEQAEALEEMFQQALEKAKLIEESRCETAKLIEDSRCQNVEGHSRMEKLKKDLERSKTISKNQHDELTQLKAQSKENTEELVAKIEKVNALLKTQLNENAAELMCSICMENNAKDLVAIAPCGHAGFCQSCAAKMLTCPVCRSPLDHVLRIYLAAN